MAVDPEVFDIALVVQACIIADQPISVDLLYGLHEDPQVIDTTIELLTDRALFPPVTDGTYRSPRGVGCDVHRTGYRTSWGIGD